MRRHSIAQYFKRSPQKGSNTGLFFNGNNDNLTNNGAILLEERISLFDGRTNPIRVFSVDDLNSMNVNNDIIFTDGGHDGYAGVWDMKPVMVKIFYDSTTIRDHACREIAVATQMGTHRNVQRLLGCCLETRCPVLVYERPENKNLDHRVLNYSQQSVETLEWKERLRIAWEIAHAVSYLHTAFRRPIIHRDLKPHSVFLDQEGSVRLSNFSLCISIPEGEDHVKDNVKGTIGYLAPDYLRSGLAAESTDVYAFGVLLLVLLTGKSAVLLDLQVTLPEWVKECFTTGCLTDILDPAIPRNGSFAEDSIEHHLKALVELALRCSAEEEVCRPTMVDVATELRNMIFSSYDPL